MYVSVGLYWLRVSWSFSLISDILQNGQRSITVYHGIYLYNSTTKSNESDVVFTITMNRNVLFSRIEPKFHQDYLQNWHTHNTHHTPPYATIYTLQWRHNGRDGVSNHQPRDCLLNRLFGGRSKKASKRRVTGLCVGNSPGTGEFPAQMASNAENVSIWWRHMQVGIEMSNYNLYVGITNYPCPTINAGLCNHSAYM